MFKLRPADERFHTKIDWLNSRHTFSFGEHYDPDHMAFRELRVINDDYIGAGKGFGTHPHRDMEIITYVLKGELAHKDSLGTGSTIRPNDLQRMSAGTGIAHSEFNPSPDNEVHLLQIWIMPDKKGRKPEYEQKTLAEPAPNQLQLIASPDGRSGSLTVHQDVSLYRAKLAAGKSVTHTLAPGRHAWLQFIEGAATAGGVELEPGDGLAVSDEAKIEIKGTKDAAFLLFDLA